MVYHQLAGILGNLCTSESEGRGMGQMRKVQQFQLEFQSKSDGLRAKGTGVAMTNQAKQRVK